MLISACRLQSIRWVIHAVAALCIGDQPCFMPKAPSCHDQLCSHPGTFKLYLAALGIPVHLPPPKPLQQCKLFRPLRPSHGPYQ